MSPTDNDRTRDAARSDGERQPVEGTADLLDHGRCRRVEHELTAQLDGSAGEERDRLLLGQGLELDDDLGARPEIETRGDHVLDQAQPKLFQTRVVRTSPVTRVQQRLATEEGQALAGQLERDGGVPCRPGGGARGGELEPRERRRRPRVPRPGRSRWSSPE
jgi:hypothetical protein